MVARMSRGRDLHAAMVAVDKSAGRVIDKVAQEQAALGTGQSMIRAAWEAT